jgi:hypothetical protein
MKGVMWFAVAAPVLLMTVSPARVLGQGTFFQNLDFEQANPVVVQGSPSPDYVTAASALPYWTILVAGTQQNGVFENDPTLGDSSVGLIGPGDRFGSPIDGEYSVLLEGIFPGTTASISQTGEIPSGAKSLLFEASNGEQGEQGQFEIFLGSQSVPFIAVGGGPNYTLYGANISAWASQTAQLSFVATGGSFNTWELDDASFSTTAVPEPGMLVLIILNGIAFGVHNWQKQEW